MTEEEFHRLPLILSRRHVLRITGWCKDTFYKEVRSGRLKPVMTTARGQQRFRKNDFKFLLSS